MILKATFCCGEGEGRGDLYAFESSDMNEIKQWANDLSRSKGYRSVFNEKFQVHADDFDQWGTNYYWLRVDKK